MILRDPISIIGVRPISGPASGGTNVTITGTNFPPNAQVSFDGTPATNVHVVSSSTITATTPSGFPGEVVISVDWGSATAFYYRPECGSDLDQDGEVTAADISIVLLDFGPCYSPPVNVTASTPTPQADEPAQKPVVPKNEGN